MAQEQNTAGEDWAAAAAANPWPGDAVTEPHPLWVDGYEPQFDRLGTERRVLGHITDDVHVRGPRNTLALLDVELGEDENTRYEQGDTTDLEGYLDALVEAGLVEQRDDGTYAVTQAGLVELAN